LITQEKKGTSWKRSQENLYLWGHEPHQKKGGGGRLSISPFSKNRKKKEMRKRASVPSQRGKGREVPRKIGVTPMKLEYVLTGGGNQFQLLYQKGWPQLEKECFCHKKHDQNRGGGERKGLIEKKKKKTGLRFFGSGL